MKVFCILSDERAARLKSPEIFTKILKCAGIRGAYVSLQVKPHELGQALKSLKVLNFAGANVTVPYKEAVVPYLDILSEGAQIIGAINTIVRNGETLKGYNTNAIGFMDALADIGFDVAGKSAMVFGTGGAARAVVFILNWLRASSVSVVGRRKERAAELAREFGGKGIGIEDLNGRKTDVDLIVNTTSASSPDEAPDLADRVARMEMTGCRLVFDLNYGRKINFWENSARKCEVRFVDGMRSLAFQARRTFALWTGIQVPPEEILQMLQDDTTP
jgi:shikimate dehydrogenase